MNEPETIAKILAMKKIAVVGISENHERPSFIVAKYLQENGFEVVPINPALSSWEGIKAYPDLRAIPFKVEVVDVFRKPDAVPEIAGQAIEIGARALWLQEGVGHAEAEARAEAAGLLVVANLCLKKEHAKFLP